MTERIRSRRLVRTLALAGAAALATTLIGCGDDGPTGPPSRAALVSRGDLDFACGVSCSYEGEGFNGGTACAARVRGVTRLLRPDGSELASDEWQLEPARRIGVGEAFLYGDCCFSLGDVNGMGSYRTEIFWDEASCG
jgi:hypothetical protein